MIISRSIWRKLVVLVVAVVGFVLLYETRILDSTSAALQSIIHQRAQASPGARLHFQATAYCKGTTTASGVGVRTGIAAADPQLLPVGSVLNVAVGDDRYNGVYTVMDTGPKVQGRLLDLYIWSCHEALRFGRRDVEITILRLGWNPTASSPTLIDRLFKGREAKRRIPPAADPPPAGVAPVETPVSAAEPEATTAETEPLVAEGNATEPAPVPIP
jgi:3D (Asp-Asp-Asp) domain-containing protein